VSLESSEGQEHRLCRLSIEKINGSDPNGTYLTLSH
jgi:hypothetical protein